MAGSDRIYVFVSIAPQKYFVEKIGGDLVDVSVMVEPGASPATYEPRPKQMAAISETKIFFSIGVPFEKAWLKKITSSNQNMKIVPTDQRIRKIPMSTHYHHDKGGHHEKGKIREAESQVKTDRRGRVILDPHIWLSPPLVMIQVRTILRALQEADQVNRSVYEANYQSFASELLELDAELRETLKSGKGLQFMVFHPAWGYFAHAYGLKQVPIEIEGKEPKPAQLKELIAHAKENNIKVIFVQPQFSAKSAKQIAKEMGGQVVFADPLAADWANNLKDMANKFKAALR